MAGGAALGAWLLALERSQTFHVFADLLNATARNLGPRIDQAVLIRLDAEPVTLALYVGLHALLGAAVGFALGLFRKMENPLRWLTLAVVLAAVDVVVFGAVWRHRLLSMPVGVALVGVGGLLAMIAAAAASRVVSRLPATVRGASGVIAPIAVAAWIALTIHAHADVPASPSATPTEDFARIDSGTKVAILALDGLDGRIVDRALAEGRMPHLAALHERGTRAHLRSIRPPKSPVVWTSVVTGAVPKRHGIVDFVVRRGGDKVPVTSNLRRVPALWNIAGDAGFTVAFVNWYVTWPAEAVPGAIISDRVDFDGLERRVFPEALTAAVDSARARVDLRPDRSPLRFTTRTGEDYAAWQDSEWGQLRRALRVLDDVIRHDLVTLETAKVALRRGQPDLTALYFRGNDNTQHLFWKYHLARNAGVQVSELLYEPIDPAEAEAFGQVVDRYYDFIDEIVGEAVAMLEPGTAILVCSDHGFRSNNERKLWWNPNALLAAGGFAVLEPDAGGRADALRSRAFVEGLPTDAARFTVRLGPEGTESDLDAVVASLSEARTDTGDALCRSVARRESDEGEPTVVAVLNRELTGEALRIAGAELPAREFRFPRGHSGDHRMNGFLLAAGGPFAAGADVTGARVVDLAPTVLWALGAPVAEDMEGVALGDLFTAEWRAANPLRSVETYGSRDLDHEGDAIPTAMDERIREELRALGYLD